MGILSRLFHRDNGEAVQSVPAASPEVQEIQETVIEAAAEPAQPAAAEAPETSSQEPSVPESAEPVPAFDPDNLPDIWFGDPACAAYTDSELRSVEQDLGYRLPAAYVALTRAHNGGIVRLPKVKMPSGCDTPVYITDILAVGHSPRALAGLMGSEFLTVNYGHMRDIGVAVCNTAKAGKGLVFLDYRYCGRTGEPRVIYSDSDTGTEITLAENFGEFVMGLSEETFK